MTTQTNSRDSVWMRGVRNRYNDKFLLLVDGMPVADPVYSHAPTDEYFPLDNVERGRYPRPCVRPVRQQRILGNR